MGIKSLNTFIHKYPVPLLRDVEISKAKVVIDGSELVYHLYFDCGRYDSRCGGEYAGLRRITGDFIDTMRKCDVEIFVVFDTFKSENNIGRYLKTRSKKLAGLRQLVNHGVPDVMLRPLMGKYVLQQTLAELQVPFVIIPGDSDAELAGIANELGAAVLATDTDFCIFDLSQGFLPMGDFEWQEARKNNHRTSCHGKIFRRNIFEQVFETPSRSVAFLEPLMSSQDGLPDVDFKDFLETISGEVRVPRTLPRGNYRRPNRIECALLWLKSNYINDDQTIRLIKRKIPDLPEQRFKDCLMTYVTLPPVENHVASLRAKYSGSQADKTELTCFNEVEGSSIPASFLPVVPDDQERPSSHQIAAGIRQAIYQVGFMEKQMKEGGVDMENLKILETDRVGHDYRSQVKTVNIDENSMQSMSLHLGFDEIAERDDMMEIMGAREDFLLSAILRSDDHQEIDALGEEHKVIAATLKYWSSEQERTLPDEVRKALAFTITFIYHEMRYLPDVMLGISEKKFDKTALHYSTQWQICVCEAMRLNSLLGHPLGSPKIAKLFSGKLFQKAYYYFANNTLAVGDLRATLFGDYRDAAEFFVRILELVRL